MKPGWANINKHMVVTVQAPPDETQFAICEDPVCLAVLSASS